jgi:hypothetical protein
VVNSTDAVFAEKVDTAGRHVRRIECARSIAKSWSSANARADLKSTIDEDLVDARPTALNSSAQRFGEPSNLNHCGTTVDP